MEHGHVLLDRLGRAIIFPQFEAALSMLVSFVPLSLDVALEGLPEERTELHDVRLQTNDVTVKRKHVIDALVLEILYVDRFILLQLYKIANLVLFTDVGLLGIFERQVESVDAHWLLLALQALIHKGVHGDYVDLAKGIACLETHEVIQRL